jgi:hypothetical protein
MHAALLLLLHPQLLQFLGEEERYQGVRAMMLVAFREVFDEFRSLLHRCGRLATHRNAGQKADVERVEVNLEFLAV